MANVRVNPINNDANSVEEQAIVNANVAVHPEDSAWKHSGTNDLTVGGVIVGRAGSFIAKINLDSMEAPPFVEWSYEADEDVIDLQIANAHSRALMRADNIDLVPIPSQYNPDSYWLVNGLDLIPRR